MTDTDQQQMQPAGTTTNNTHAALAVDVPSTPSSQPPVEDGCSHGAAGDDDAVNHYGAASCPSPASPLNIHSLLNRPFGDVVWEITSGFQVSSKT